MYKKTITYIDYNGTERTEDFYFKMDELEFTELEMSTPGGFLAKMDKVVKDRDGAAMMGILKTLITTAYGEKSSDGRRFIKKPELTEEFMQTPAYSAFYMELATNEDVAASFITQILPPNLRTQVESAIKEKKAKVENLTAEKTPSET